MVHGDDLEEGLLLNSTGFANADLPEGVVPVLDVIRRALGTSIRGVYLFGSSTTGGLRPESDLDVLAAVDESPPELARRKMVADLLKASGKWPHQGLDRPVEVTVVRLRDVIPWRYPPRKEFVYGEWLRSEFEAGGVPLPSLDPDLTVVLEMVRKTSIALEGPEAATLFDPIPADDLRRAISDSLPGLIAGLSGDERNVLLTLARMWVTLETSEIVSKDVAARLVLAKLPSEHRAVLDIARRAYLGEHQDQWSERAEDLAAFVQYVRGVIFPLAK